MNLREFIQSEIKSVLTEDYDLDQAFNDAEPVEEGVMSELDILAKEAKDLKSFVKTVFKEFDNLPKNNETLKWLEGIYKDSKNESVNEAPSRRSTDFFEDSKHGIAIQKLLKGKWDSKKVEAFLEKLGDGNDVKHARILDFIAGSLGMNIRKYKTLGDMMPELIKTIEQLYKTHNESINEAWKTKKVTKQMWAKMDDDKKIDALLSVVKDPDDYKKYFDKKWNELPSGFERDMYIFPAAYESVNEVKKGEFEMGDFVHFKSANKTGMVKKISGDKITIMTMKGDFTGDIKDIQILHQDNVNEEQLDEKLITFSNRASYGQIVFMAGGAGSGKGFAIDNFIDAAGFKVRDVDEMKKAVGKLDQLGKFSIDKWFKKYGNKLKPDERAHVEEFVVGKGMTISDVASDLKNPNNVAALHYIVDAMGLKDAWLINMLKGKSNKETLPNLLFDITAKKVSSITEVIKPLVDAGYDSKNIHLIWVLTNYHLAAQQNKDRDRVVPGDILLNTHEGAAKTIWGILTSTLPKGLNGRIDVILNNRENTVTYKDSKGNEMKGAVKGFLSLPIKKQGGGILPEKLWKSKLYKWLVDNGPKTVDLSKPLDRQMGK